MSRAGARVEGVRPPATAGERTCTVNANVGTFHTPAATVRSNSLGEIEQCRLLPESRRRRHEQLAVDDPVSTAVARRRREVEYHASDDPR